MAWFCMFVIQDFRGRNHKKEQSSSLRACERETWSCQDRAGASNLFFAHFTCLCKRRKTKRLDARSLSTKLSREA